MTIGPEDHRHFPTQEERETAILQVDAFVRILSERYGVEPHEIVESVRWVQQKIKTSDRVRQFGAASLIGAIISAVLVALWEGLKTLMRRP